MNLKKSFNSKLKFSLLFGDSFKEKDFVDIDLSVSNLDLKSKPIFTSDNWSLYIDDFLEYSSAKIAFGGYLEKRNLYDRSDYFQSNINEDNRCIHLGVDFWTKVNTPIFSPFKGVIHSFKNNTNYGDYGPTIIVKHQNSTNFFYTLYGHLSLESLSNKKVGQIINEGELLGFLGDSTVNGDYAPHLHFQVILDLEDNFGDYPGVCSENKLDFYKTNCPNPLHYLKKNA